MSFSPKYSYWIYAADQPVDEQGVMWCRPLAINRERLWIENDFGAAHPICHRDYFLSARRFLEKDGSLYLVQAVTTVLGHQVALKDIVEVRICLVKHGAFYHPARVEALVGRHRLSFVLNVAVTVRGKACMNTEFPLLKRLNHEFNPKDIPVVYGFGTIVDHAGRYDLSMFLAEWFDGFCEFHISPDPADETYKIKVWDPEGGDFFLNREQSVQLFHNAAMIMTRYYHVMTFEHIFSWHHAAGDFVIRPDNGKINVKLVTVRHYLPLLEDTAADASRILHALLLFFLKLSLRMRLDRIDGTGSIAWIDNAAVAGTVAGFFSGLEANCSVQDLPGAFAEVFRKYLINLSADDIFDLLRHLADSFNPQSPDVPVVRKHLQSHAAELSACLKKFITI